MKERGKLAYMKGILRSYPEIRAKPPEKRTRNEQRRFDAVSALLTQVDRMEDAGCKRKLIDIVYFKRSHTLCGAAMQIPVCERTAQAWNAEFMDAMSQIIDLM